MFKLAGNIDKHFNVVGEEKDAESGTTHVKLVEKHNNIPCVWFRSNCYTR